MKSIVRARYFENIVCRDKLNFFTAFVNLLRNLLIKLPQVFLVLSPNAFAWTSHGCGYCRVQDTCVVIVLTDMKTENPTVYLSQFHH